MVAVQHAGDHVALNALVDVVAPAVCQILENTDYSVGEIAEIVGYDNQLYFSRVFKKEYGISPAQYRKRAENQSAAPMESDVGEITRED